MTAKIIPFQLTLRPHLPNISGNKDYEIFRNTLLRIDEIMNKTGINTYVVNELLKLEEELAISQSKESGKTFSGFSEKSIISIQKRALIGIRIAIVRRILGLSYRDMSTRLADSPLIQHFCMIDRMDIIEVPSKSTIERYEKQLPEKTIRKIVNMLLTESNSTLELADPISWDDLFIDLTCIKANIHYPVDWILLRDATRTLMKAVTLIRSNGLKNRMAAPEEFISQINKQCMAMTQSKYKTGSKKARKQILRIMKKIVKKIRVHAEKHKELLENEWEKTELSEKEAFRIIKRINDILGQLPEAVRQAHERIIGERSVANADKILSLYEPDVHILVRGKAGARVEFGNTLLLSEQLDGLIVDWKLYKDMAPHDAKASLESIIRTVDTLKTPIKSVTTDRGCNSQELRDHMKSEGITDYVCPKSPKSLEDKLADKEFVKHQKRRGQTEGRIGILKNVYLNQLIKSKGFKNRELTLSLGVLAHNLCIMARLPQKETAGEEQAA